MDYFIDSPDWIDLVIDQELYSEIIKFNPILSKSLNLGQIDGFYFKDKNDFIILVDTGDHQLMTYLSTGKEEITYSKKLSQIDIDGQEVFYQNKIIIKNGKKFYKLMSKKKSKIIKKLLEYDLLKKILLKA
jgi:hypothetical protein